MKAFKIFLSYYSIITATVLLIGSLFFLPKPYGYIHTALFIPIVFYFWISSSAPKEVDSGRWSARFLTIVFIMSVLGIFGLYLTNYLPQQEETSKNQTQALLSEIKESIEKSKESDIDDLSQRLERIENAILGIEKENPQIPSYEITNDSESILDILDKQEKSTRGYVKVKHTGFETVDIYEDAQTSSKVIGKAKENDTFPYYESRGNYYEIDVSDHELLLDGYTQGFINANYVEEVNE